MALVGPGEWYVQCKKQGHENDKKMKGRQMPGVVVVIKSVVPVVVVEPVEVKEGVVVEVVDDGAVVVVVVDVAQEATVLISVKTEGPNKGGLLLDAIK